jgi:hypothetical protein
MTEMLERMTRIAVAFARASTVTDTRWCTACIDVLKVSGAGITVMGGDHDGPVCVSNARMAALEDLQYTTGEGPCRDAFAFGLPVAAPNLDGEDAHRWPAFIDLAVASGVGSVFAYPLQSARLVVGVLTLYGDASGSLSGDQHADSLALAVVLAEAMLSLQDAAMPGDLAVGLEDAVAYRAQVHQATGMVAVQLHVSAFDALVRIRAHAFANGLSIETVAAQIVARGIHLADDRVQPLGDV